MEKRSCVEMRGRRSANLVSILMVFAFYAADGRAAEPTTPLEVFGRLPTLEDIVLSPDGSRAALVKTDGEERNLLVVRTTGHELLGGAHVGNAKLRSLSWIDDEHLLIEVSSTSPPPMDFSGPIQEWRQLLTYDIPKKKLAPLNFAVPNERTFNIVIGTPMVRVVNGSSALFVEGWYVTDRTLPALFRYDVNDQRMRIVARASEGWTRWLVDGSGEIAGEYLYDDNKKRWEMRAPKSAHSMRVLTSGDAPIDVPSVLGFDRSGDSILMSFREDGDEVWKPLSLKDGSWGDPVGARKRFDEVIGERTTGRIIGGRTRDRYVFFDNELQAHWDATLRAFPGEVVYLASHSDDYSKIVVRAFGAKDRYVYAMFDWYSHQTVILGNVYEGLAGVAEQQHLSYKAADGFEIPAYLTLPMGRPASHLPLVVLPHGGPAAADEEGFDWWAQALAAQGYAVLQPNYRGSDLGARFIAAGFGEWGRKMQSDLSDGLSYLADKGIIDRSRVCIVGGSYGGYAALAGVTLQSGIYRCAVSVSGIADMKRFMEWINITKGRRDNLGQRYLDRFLGVSGPGDPTVAAISPIEHLAAVSAPVLLIHGKDDTVVPYEQSDRMADALKHAGKHVEFVKLKHEDHWLSRSETRLEMLEATVAFLKANNPPD
jgi:dipeptidyl aminopeptidase/acylaminoacyl peptidase